eukprot:GGOE01006210.1.p2 GENE.GGOE01006210.1~~GGOE01006210.1.p2  ORF type:complete len:724 (-),score=187.91 GGOE01006210.1:728-2899(-)
MYAFEEDPSKFTITTVTYAREYDATALAATAPQTTRYEAYTAKAVEAPTNNSSTAPSATENQFPPKKAAEKAASVQMPGFQTILEREIHVRMPVQDVLNKQITVTCAHTNCQNSIRTCHFHTCPHCGEDKRYAELMCVACSRDPKRSTAKGGNNPAAQVYLPNIPESSLQRIRHMGGGTHSSVHECIYDGLSACEKVLLKNDPQVLLDEARVMAQVDRHPNILRIYGVCQRANGETSIILELMQYDLLDILRSFNRHVSKGDLPKVVPNLVDYLCQAAYGLRHMHRHGVIHRDVAARNMLFGNDVIKVADFGLAKCTSNRMTHGLPKPLSTAPECIRDLENPSIWTDRSDVWSFGLMLCEIFELGLDPLEHFHHSVPALMDSLDKGWLPKRPALMPDTFWELTVRCLRLNAQERPSMDELVTIISVYRHNHRHEPKLPTKNGMIETKAESFEMPQALTPTLPPPALTPPLLPVTSLSVPPPASLPMALPMSSFTAALDVSMGMDGKGWGQSTGFPTMYSPTMQAPAIPDVSAEEAARNRYDYDVIRNLQSPIDILPAANSGRLGRKDGVDPPATFTTGYAGPGTPGASMGSSSVPEPGSKARSETRTLDSTEVSKPAAGSQPRARPASAQMNRTASMPPSIMPSAANAHVEGSTLRAQFSRPGASSTLRGATVQSVQSYHSVNELRRPPSGSATMQAAAYSKVHSLSGSVKAADFAALPTTFY